VKSFNITTSSALALITVWHFNVFAALALVVKPITKETANIIEMIFFILISSLCFLKNEVSQNKNLKQV
jgi:hypothetical protein